MSWIASVVLKLILEGQGHIKFDCKFVTSNHKSSSKFRNIDVIQLKCWYQKKAHIFLNKLYKISVQSNIAFQSEITWKFCIQNVK